MRLLALIFRIAENHLEKKDEEGRFHYNVGNRRRLD